MPKRDSSVLYDNDSSDDDNKAALPEVLPASRADPNPVLQPGEELVKCCGSACYKSITSLDTCIEPLELRTLANLELTKEQRSRRIFKLITDNVLITRYKYRYTYTVHFSYDPYSRNVCSKFFLHAYNLKWQQLRYYLDHLKSITVSAPVVLRDNPEMQAHVDLYSLMLQARAAGMGCSPFEITSHARIINTLFTSFVRNIDKRLRSNKIVDLHFDTYENGSLFAALVPNCARVPLLLDIKRDAPPAALSVNFATSTLRKRPEAAKFALATLQCIADAHACIDSYRGLVGYRVLPPPFSTRALVQLLFQCDTDYYVLRVRTMCAQLRLMPHVDSTATYADTPNFTKVHIDRHCRLCSLTGRSLSVWAAADEPSHACAPPLHATLNAFASSAQELFASSYVASASYVMLNLMKSSPLKIRSECIVSVDMGLVDTLVPQQRTVWRADATYVPPAAASYAVPFVSAINSTQSVNMCLVTDAQLDYRDQVFVCFTQALGNFLAHLNEKLSSSYAEDVNNNVSVYHASLVIRCTPLLDLSHNIQQFTAYLVQSNCEHLRTKLPRIVYVVDVHWHWLPTEHCGVWFAPHQLALLTDRVVRQSQYTNLDNFCVLLQTYLPVLGEVTSITPHEAALAVDSLKAKLRSYATLNTPKRPIEAFSFRSVSRLIHATSIAPIPMIAELDTSSNMPLVYIDSNHISDYSKKTMDMINECLKAPNLSPNLVMPAVIQRRSMTVTAANADEAALLESAVRQDVPTAQSLFTAAVQDAVSEPFVEFKFTNLASPDKLVTRQETNQSVTFSVPLSHSHCYH